MAKRRQPEGADDLTLDAREEAILRSVIQAHILTGEPIGSQKVSKDTRLDLSPASIRNTMAELEEKGLLVQPHTSAGRVPTSKAYRKYVSRLMHRPRISALHTKEIDRALRGSRGEITELLGQASHQLSRFSNQVGVVLAPTFSRIIVEHMEFVRLDDRRVVAVVVGRTGVVHNRILEVTEPHEQVELDRIGRYLSIEFGGHSLDEIRSMLVTRMSEERAAYDRLMARTLDLGSKTVEAETEETGVYVDGASNLLGSPEFADPEKIQGLMRALEQKKTLIELLSRVIEDEGVQVVIGEEQSSPALAQCSLVASPYRAGGRVLGTLGIVGPTRMEYARAVALVDYLACVLTEFFSEAEN